MIGKNIVDGAVHGILVFIVDMIDGSSLSRICIFAYRTIRFIESSTIDIKGVVDICRVFCVCGFIPSTP
jgi:hypothetical protein